MGAAVRGSLAWRISSAYLILILSMLLALALYGIAFTRTAYLDQLELQLAAEASIVAGEVLPLLSAGDQPGLQAVVERIGRDGGGRLTVIALDGTVLGDSAERPETLENHGTRPEVVAALRGERGVSSRHSVSVGYDMLYVAVPIAPAGRVLGVARAALPLATIDRVAEHLARAVALAVGLAAAAAGGLALWLGRTTTRSVKQLTLLAGAMAAGRLEGRLAVISRDELGDLGRAFNRMADRLQETIGEISAERNRLAAILRAVADGLVIVDAEQQVALINPAAERLLGTHASQAVGQTFVAVARDHELVELLAGPDGSSRLVTLGRPGRQVRALTAPIPDSRGQRLLLLQDVTELRRVETVRRDFVANVSHELRTPLAALKAVIETLEDGALEDPTAARSFLGHMHGEVDKLAELVRELLELSRIESGAARIAPRPTELAPLLSAVADRLEPLAQRSGLTLERAFRPDLPAALADGERVGQVVGSLLHNAIKFTPEGGRIVLRAERRGDELLVSVEDSGVGVPPSDLERIFERFYKTDRSRASGGTGLGLAIAKHLVQAHGGRIWAESAGTRGTTFHFTLPIAAAEPRPALQGATWQGS